MLSPFLLKFTVSQGVLMKPLFNLTIVRKKLVIEQLREITIHDIVPVRETLNSIDFILGDDNSWKYKKVSKGWIGTTKVRLFYSEDIIKFIEDNKDKLRIDPIDRAYITDLTKVFKITRTGKSEKEIKKLDLDAIILGNKNRIIKLLNEAVSDINDIAETMGGIL